MANVLFIGWDEAVRGREQNALQMFGEAIHYWEQLVFPSAHCHFWS